MGDLCPSFCLFCHVTGFGTSFALFGVQQPQKIVYVHGQCGRSCAVPMLNYGLCDDQWNGVFRNTMNSQITRKTPDLWQGNWQNGRNLQVPCPCDIIFRSLQMTPWLAPPSHKNRPAFHFPILFSVWFCQWALSFILVILIFFVFCLTVNTDIHSSSPQ